jgi:cobalt/nickel transport system permease protein
MGAIDLPVAMHIPDGYLHVGTLPATMTLIVTWLLAIALIAISLKQVRAHYQEQAIPLMGVCAAFVFAAQMVNFPIPGGTSGHLLGGVLAAVLLGPWAGTLVMTVVFMVQAVMFQDGGLTVLGANLVNMGLVGTCGGYYLYKLVRQLLGQDQWRGVLVGTAVAAWCSVVAGAIACAIELALSGTTPLWLGLPALAGWHVMIGLGEALITVVAVNYVRRTRPDLIYHAPPPALSPTLK